MGNKKKTKFSGQHPQSAVFPSSRPASGELPPSLAQSISKHDSGEVGQSDKTGAERTPSETVDSAKGIGAAESARHRERGGSKLSAPGSLPRWMGEREKRIASYCATIQRRMDAGQTFAKASRSVLHWHGKQARFYRREPARRFRLSEGMLVNSFYQWRKGGCKPEALVLKYRAPKKIAHERVEEFAMACLADGICSLQDARASLRCQAGTVHAFRRLLPARVREAIIRLFAARRRANWDIAQLQRRARKTLKGMLCN